MAQPEPPVSVLLRNALERLATNAWHTEGLVEAVFGVAHSDGPVSPLATRRAAAAFIVLAESIQGFAPRSESEAFLTVLAWDCDPKIEWERKLEFCRAAAQAAANNEADNTVVSHQRARF